MSKRETNTTQPSTWYAGFVAKWPANVGPVPTAAMWAVAGAMAKRSPNLEAVNIAMNLRPLGATVAEYIIASGAGGAARNHRGDLVKAGLVQPLTAQGRHYLKLTDKGKAHCLAAGMRASDLAGLLVTASGQFKGALAPKVKRASLVPAKAKRVTAKANKAKAPPTEPAEPAVRVGLVTTEQVQANG